MNSSNLKNPCFCVLVWQKEGFFMRFIKLEPDKRIEKVIETLRLGARSEGTIENYAHAIHRFLNFFKDKDVSTFTEEDIIEYIKTAYLKKNCSVQTYNMNLSAIKFFYSINFNKEFNAKLLPRAKSTKKLPVILEKDVFLRILNGEENLKHKCWLLLAYCSGLRAEEVATVEIKNIFSKEHKLKVLGKRKKERYTFLPDITIKYLRLYYESEYIGFWSKKNKSGYLFEGNQGTAHISSGSIINYFTSVKKKYNLPEDISFHSLRHSFATNYLKATGDAFTLKSMLGHSSLNTTSIYIHTGRDFNNLKGVKYENM